MPFFKVYNGLQEKDSRSKRASKINSAKIILHTLRTIFPDEIEILLLLGKIYLEEQNLKNAALFFQMCTYNLKNMESLNDIRISLLGRTPEKLFSEASYLYDSIMSLQNENIILNLYNNISSNDAKKDSPK
ncbi:MAG: hypothetical protein H0T62_07740 [Parachlamydiaceae bacterium]|nr:hypothetical protein [Parachlamydiaceae bacterium]